MAVETTGLHLLNRPAGELGIISHLFSPISDGGDTVMK